MNISASGITQEVTETDKILDNLIHEIEEYNEENTADAHNLRRREQGLVESVNKIRNMPIFRPENAANAVNSMKDGAVTDVENEVLDDICEVTESPRRKRRRPHTEEDSDNEVQSCLCTDTVHLKNVER